MSTPPKPWENVAGVHNRMADIPSAPSTSFLPSPAPERPFGQSSASVTNLSTPPPLPPRPQANNYGTVSSFGMPYQNLGGYGGYGGMGGYGGLGGYGGYGGMGGYGGYGMVGNMCGYNRYGVGGMYGDVESRFIQMAEESTRPTFQSIESIVGAVGSIAMMLENTFIAMTSSFRAILGVAENFGRMRSLFAQFWSAFAVFRSINWLIKKLLVKLGIRTEAEFKAWAQATAAAQREAVNGQSPENRRPAGSWAAMIFLGVIMTAPYIIMKIFSSLRSTIDANVMDPSTWKNPMKALTQFDFQATSPRELSFSSNQVITIAPQDLQGSFWNSGWLMATVDNRSVGLIPTNHVKVFRNTPPVPAVSFKIDANPNRPNIAAETVDTTMTKINEKSNVEVNSEPISAQPVCNDQPLNSVQPPANFEEFFEKAKEEL